LAKVSGRETNNFRSPLLECSSVHDTADDIWRLPVGVNDDINGQQSILQLGANRLPRHVCYIMFVCHSFISYISLCPPNAGRQLLPKAGAERTL
jgi:hypothetical protein